MIDIRKKAKPFNIETRTSFSFSLLFNCSIEFLMNSFKKACFILKISSANFFKRLGIEPLDLKEFEAENQTKDKNVYNKLKKK